MRLEVLVLQRVSRVDAAAIEAGPDEHQRRPRGLERETVEEGEDGDPGDEQGPERPERAHEPFGPETGMGQAQGRLDLLQRRFGRLFGHSPPRLPLRVSVPEVRAIPESYPAQGFPQSSVFGG